MLFSTEQHSSRSHPSSHPPNHPTPPEKETPGVQIEGRRIPPPALTPLTNAPKPPNLDSFDRMDKKKKKKKKDRGDLSSNKQADKRERESASPPQKPEHPSDIPPPRGFAAPLHPHMQVLKLISLWLMSMIKYQ